MPHVDAEAWILTRCCANAQRCPSRLGSRRTFPGAEMHPAHRPFVTKGLAQITSIKLPPQLGANCDEVVEREFVLPASNELVNGPVLTNRTQEMKRLLFTHGNLFKIQRTGTRLK